MAMTCPECGEPGIPLVIGLPGEELQAAATRGRVKLGGCIGEPGSHWECTAGHQWEDDDEARWTIAVDAAIESS